MKGELYSVTLDGQRLEPYRQTFQREVEYNYTNISTEVFSINYSPELLRFPGENDNQSKLEQVRRKYSHKLSTQPEGYRQQSISDQKKKHKIHPTLQEELASEWGLKNASKK